MIVRSAIILYLSLCLSRCGASGLQGVSSGSASGAKDTPGPASTGQANATGAMDQSGSQIVNQFQTNVQPGPKTSSSPIASPTAAPTATTSSDALVTPTPSSSALPSPTTTVTPSPSPTVVVRPTPSVTPRPSPSPSILPSPTPTPAHLVTQLSRTQAAYIGLSGYAGSTNDCLSDVTRASGRQFVWRFHVAVATPVSFYAHLCGVQSQAPSSAGLVPVQDVAMVYNLATGSFEYQNVLTGGTMAWQTAVQLDPGDYLLVLQAEINSYGVSDAFLLNGLTVSAPSAVLIDEGASFNP